MSFACFGFAMSQTAQSFVPDSLLSHFQSKNFCAIMKQLFVIASFMALLNQASTWIIKDFG